MSLNLPETMDISWLFMFRIQNNDVTDPAVNLALEEYCLRNSSPQSEFLLFYINRPSIIIGRHQNPFQEINFDLAIEKNLFWARRISGGGAVYHDLGNLNFSFITDFAEEKLDYFKTLIHPILKTLLRLGVPAELTQKNTILVEGKKISGNSQHTNLRRMLSHGTLLFNSDLVMLQRVLESNLAITHSRAVASVKSSVTNLADYLTGTTDLSNLMNELTAGVSAAFGELHEYRLTADEWNGVHRLTQEKYRSWQWTFGRSPEFSVRHPLKLSGRSVDADIQVKHGLIEDIKIVDHGLENAAVRNLINRLIGKRFDSYISFDR